MIVTWILLSLAWLRCAACVPAADSQPCHTSPTKALQFDRVLVGLTQLKRRAVMMGRSPIGF